jgi:hypothetical protein
MATTMASEVKYNARICFIVAEIMLLEVLHIKIDQEITEIAFFENSVNSWSPFCIGILGH